MVRFGQSNDQRIIGWLVLGGLLLPALQACAGEDFAANWQPKPLVDTSVSPMQTVAKSSDASASAPAVVQADLEARLKPVEPFVKEVENRLTLTPKPGVSMVQRLNTLQTVLFGAQQYQDAGQLITRLAEIFPQEAQKAQAEMDKQTQQAVNVPTGSKLPNVSKGGMNPTNQPPAPSSSITNAQSATKPVSPKKKRRGFWDTDDFNSDFDNDPFFQDSFRGRLKTSAFQSGSTQTQSQASQPLNAPTYSTSPPVQQQGNGPSRLAAMAQGLAGVALAVGGLAGAYYLNNKMGVRSQNSPYNGAYGNPYGYGNVYGYSPYGVPYGYGNTNLPYGASSYGMPAGMNGYNTVPFSGNGINVPYGRTFPLGSMGQTYSYTPGFGQTVPGVTQYFGY